MRRFSTPLLFVAWLALGCSEDSSPGAASGGQTSSTTGGASTGGATTSTGGQGTTTGGAGPSGGTTSGAGGTSTGGAASAAGGETAPSGGTSPGGAPGGGAPSGGTDSGGAGAGGVAGGGADAGGGGTPSGGGTAGGGPSGEMEWLPSWATTIQRTEQSNLPPPLGGKTLRQFVWPTVAGNEIRIQLSNEKGTTPVAIQKVNIALAATTNDPGNSMGAIDAATDASFTFGGEPAVTIPAGETVWSDALTYPLPEIKLTAISILFGDQVPTAITGHPGARTTSYVANGDVVSSASITGETRDRWYFINAIEVMAPADAYAIAVLGDSITDGYGVLNRFGRWPDFLTVKIQEDPMIKDNRSVLNFGMGANTLTGSVGGDQDPGVVRFERDVLKRDKIKWLIVFEGVNDINGSASAQQVIDAYQQIIDKCREKGIAVYGSPITPTNVAAGMSKRTTVNEWVRMAGNFDAVIDLDMVIRDPGNPNAIASMYNNDGLHPNLAGYEAMGNSVDLSLFYEVP